MYFVTINVTHLSNKERKGFVRQKKKKKKKTKEINGTRKRMLDHYVYRYKWGNGKADSLFKV